MVLGSGFQQALTHLEVAREFAYGQLPGFPTVGVTGHAGKPRDRDVRQNPGAGAQRARPLLRRHGNGTADVPGARAGGIRHPHVIIDECGGSDQPPYRSGDFMALEDHINFMGANPLRGPALPGLPRFVDLTRVYDRRLIEVARKAAKKSKLRLHTGVYMAVSGPNYETPAEIRAFRRLGADAIGMSTVPEAIVARQCGLAVAGISCITNKAGGDEKAGVLVHQDVLAMGESKKDEMARFLKAFAVLHANLGK
jgi:purine-nucleoside phosphorylase